MTWLSLSDVFLLSLDKRWCKDEISDFFLINDILLLLSGLDIRSLRPLVPRYG